MKREKYTPSVWWILGALIVPFIRATTRFRIHNAENLPKTGPFILTPNHLSNIDPLIVAVAVWRLGRAPRFFAKASLFTIPVVGMLFRAVGQIPVERGGLQRGSIPLDAAKRVVSEGQCVIVYPEGALTRDPELWPMRGKTGAARLAIQLGIPVIPAAQWGSQQLMPVNTTRFKFFPRPQIDIIFGEPVDMSPWAGRGTDTVAVQEATKRIMTTVTDLLEGLRGEVAPEVRWNPADHHQSEIGRF